MNLNEKSKYEKLFLLLLFCVGVFGIFCISGCSGDESCETIQCYNESKETYSVKGISLPGCGGCFSPGQGVDSCLYSQSHKLMSVSEKTDKEQVDLKACDTVYYGGGCLGCFQERKSCYIGFGTAEGKVEAEGIFYGTDQEETIIGCVDGKSGCVKSSGVFETAIKSIEVYEGIY